MLTLEELRNWLSDVQNIIIDLNVSIMNAKRLILVDNYPFENEIKKHGFFQHHIDQLKFITVIQLCKLLSDNKNEKRSFYKLINRMQNDKFCSHFNLLLLQNSNGAEGLLKTRQEVIFLTNNLKAKLDNHKVLINKIIEARDKIYAHTDPYAKVAFLSFEELNTLVELTSTIFNEIQFKIFFNSVMLDHLIDWEIDYILQYMSEFRKIEYENIMKKIIPPTDASL